MFFIVLAWVLFALLMLVLLLLMCRVTLRISYDKDVYIYAYLGFVKIKLHPKKEKCNKQSRLRKKDKKLTSKNLSCDDTEQKSAVQEQRKKSDKTQNKQSAQEKKSSDVADTVNFITDCIKKVLQFFGKRARIEVDRLELVVSKQEAADTAVQFGLACGAVSTVVALCSEFGSYRVNHKKVRVIPDFVTGKSSIAVDISISARIVWILECAVKIFYNKLISSERTAKK